MQSHIGCICLTFPHCAFSNVSLNRLPEKKHSCIGCIYLTFLHCAFLNVFSNGLLEKKKSHWLHLFDFSPLCVIKCLFKWLAWEDAKSHWLHLFDLLLSFVSPIGAFILSCSSIFLSIPAQRQVRRQGRLILALLLSPRYCQKFKLNRIFGRKKKAK